MKNTFVNMFLVITILLAVSLGCLGPSASSSQCEGVVKSNGKTYVGLAKDENQAGLNACNKFCAEEDDKAKGMINTWLGSDAAKEFEKKMKRKPTKEDAVIEDKTILDYVTLNCAVRCKTEANKGRHTLETACKK
ncbi:MAG: hypothetical protein HC846_03385 [Blastocatellia bacterium]|nr:hypothetical protein [Blastocatellia bacterium]